MRKVTFEYEKERDRELFEVLYLVYVTSQGVPNSLEELTTAMEIKKKLGAVSLPGERITDRHLKPAAEPIQLEESEWGYLIAAITPPKGRWTNLGADTAIEIIKRLKETPSEG
jgi:hypothetical protein